ncbi:MAG: VCBS repeat-containing protein [Planctomycetaceae bacterium]
MATWTAMVTSTFLCPLVAPQHRPKSGSIMGQAFFQTAVSHWVVVEVRMVELGDIDGDGDLDAVTSHEGSTNSFRFWINDGSGNFTDNGSPVNLAGTARKGLALGDLDGDGDLDLYGSTYGAGPEAVTDSDAVFLNDGTGIFSLHQTVPDTGKATWGVSMGDVDGDGDLDVAIAQNFDVPKVLLNDGTGTFTLGQALTGAFYASYSTELADFDNDGDLDLLVTNSSSGGDTIWFNDGTGQFTDSGQSLGSQSGFTSAVGDLDGDGDLDFVSASLSSPNTIWLNKNITLPYSNGFEADHWGLYVNNPQNVSLVEEGGGNQVFQTDNSGLTGLSTALVPVENPLPGTYEMSVLMTAISGPNRWLNGFLIFDYHSPTDFKYAGMFNGQNQWAIGHYQGNFNNKLVNDNLTIDNDVAYLVHLHVEGSMVRLAVDGNVVLERTFAGNLNGGDAGLASFNAVTQFDNLRVGVVVNQGAPSDLPYSEDFTDGIADRLGFYGGNRWGINPVSGNNKLFFNGGNGFGLGVAFLENQIPLPNSFEFSTVMASYSAAGFWNDGFLVFDYQGPNDFKYAGMFTGQDEWIIGHYQGNWGNRIASASRELYTSTEYTLLLKVDGDHVALYVDGLPVVDGTFTNGIGDGTVGVAGYNSRTSFDNIEIALNVDQSSPKQLPYVNDFESQAAPDLFYYNKLAWGFTNGANKYLRANTSYLTSPARQLATAYVPLDYDTAPEGILIQARVNAKNGASSEHNGYIIFDYQHEFDFKYAGFNVETNEWVIGQYDGSWNTLSSTPGGDLNPSIQTDRWYDLEVTIAGSLVSLKVDGNSVLPYNIGTPVNQGGIGLAVYKAFTLFDELSITELAFSAPEGAPLAGEASSSLAAGSDFTFSEAADWTTGESLSVNTTSDVPSIALSTEMVPAGTDFTISVDLTSIANADRWHNGFIIFDYKSNTDFKYAGMFAGQNEWVIGHYQGDWSNRMAQVDDLMINIDQTYHLELNISGGNVELIVDGESMLTTTFDNDVSTGSTGLAAQNSQTNFDHFLIESLSSSPFDELFVGWGDESDELLS